MAKIPKSRAKKDDGSFVASGHELEERALARALRKLPAKTRARLAPLAVLQGGGHAFMIDRVLELDSETAEAAELSFELVQAGLAHHVGDAYFRFDPAFLRHLAGELDVQEEGAIRARWAQSCADLIDFLDEHEEQDGELVIRLTASALPNFLACLDHLPAILEPVPLMGLAMRLERLVALLGDPQPLARVAQFRETAAAHPAAAAHLKLMALLDELIGDEDDESFDDDLDADAEDPDTDEIRLLGDEIAKLRKPN